MRGNVSAGESTSANKQPARAPLRGHPFSRWCVFKTTEGRPRRDALTGRSFALLTLLILHMLPSYAGSRFQNTESKTEMAAAKFPRLVAEYLKDLHSRHPVLAAAGRQPAAGQRLDETADQAGAVCRRGADG